MSAAAETSAITPADADRLVEGWRLGHRSARYVVTSLAGEADTVAGRRALAAALGAIDAIPTIDSPAVMERADRLASAIRAALALAGEGLGQESITILKDAIQ